MVVRVLAASMLATTLVAGCATTQAQSPGSEITKADIDRVAAAADRAEAAARRAEMAAEKTEVIFNKSLRK